MDRFTCQRCGRVNELGAVCCVGCSALLDEPLNHEADPTLPNLGDGAVTRQLPVLRLADPADALDLDEVSLAMADTTEPPVTVQVTNRLLLGRLVVDAEAQPSLDLTRYGGFTKGVSRHHATLHRTPKGLVIEDVGSTNGTRLNGERLEPHEWYRLKSGDHLQLGALEIRIGFRTSPSCP